MRRLAPVLSLALLLPSTAGAQVADWESRIQLGSRELPIHAWFNVARTEGFLRVGDWTSKVYRAWKVEIADLDGDGTDEVLLGIWSDQRRHDEPDPHRTVWVLRWDPDREKLVEAWRGSALAQPLQDFGVRDHHLVATERLAQTCRETTYRWTGFGFAAVHTTPHPCASHD